MRKHPHDASYNFISRYPLRRWKGLVLYSAAERETGSFGLIEFRIGKVLLQHEGEIIQQHSIPPDRNRLFKRVVHFSNCPAASDEIVETALEQGG